jgi:peptidoglycan/LPS O-acetylase OafA/YrhL
LVASSLAIRFALVVNGFTTGVWCYWFVPATLCMFGMGSLGYWAYRRIKTWRWAAWIGWAAIAGMVGWVLVMTWLYDIVIPVNGTNSLDEPRFWIAYLSFALALPFAFCATKRVALDRMIGDLSYPLYIVHGLIIGLLFNQLGHPESNGFVLLAAAVSIAAAVAMRIVVEIPAERRFKDLPTHRPSLAEPSAVPIAATSQ